jgi:hypothetical protein
VIDVQSREREAGKLQPRVVRRLGLARGRNRKGIGVIAGGAQKSAAGSRVSRPGRISHTKVKLQLADPSC